MREDSSISLYRGRLDDTLSSHDLANADTLRALVKDQIVRTSTLENEYIDPIVETRTKELSNFLGMLRSADVNDVHRLKKNEASHGSWKVKQDTEEFRVMYREGPEGTPFHTLLVEGYVDGPLDVCLCISWEAGLYQKWWPQIMVPSFRVLSSECLQKVRIGEQICLVRMKLSWPLSAREALLHYFEFEYFQDDLVVVLLNSISDLESIDRNTHGFTRDGISDAQDVVRIDVVGGFAIQKVSANRSYFRTIATLDVKLDFVPPAFINFVSRQIIGSGFKLYKKEVASVSKGDDDFGKVLKDPLYTRLKEALYQKSLSTVAPQPDDLKNGASFLLEEKSGVKVEFNSTQENVHNDEVAVNSKIEVNSTQEIVCDDDLAINSQAGDSLVEDKKSHCEIEEIQENNNEESACLPEDGNKSCSFPINEIDARFCADKQKVLIRPEVEEALKMLDEVISVFQEYRSNDETESLPGIVCEDSLNLEKVAAAESSALEADQICRNAGAFAQSAKTVGQEVIASNESRNSPANHGSRPTGCTNYSRDANHNKIAPALPDEDVTGSSETTHHTALLSPQNHIPEWTRPLPLPEKIEKEEKAVLVDSNGFSGKKSRRSKSRNPFYCCFGSLSLQ